MREPQRKPSASLPSVEGVWKSFWFLRGVLAAWLIVSLVPTWVSALSQWQVLRALHALVIEWRAVLAWLADLIPEIFWFDVVPAHLFAVGFLAACGLPALVSAREIPDKRPRRLLIKALERLPDWFWSALLYTGVFIGSLVVAYFLYDPLLVDYAIREFSAPLERRGFPSEMRFFGLFYAGLFALILCGCWVFSLFRLPGYFRGLVYVLGFIGCVEALYFVNAPGFVEWVNSRVEHAIGPE